MEKRGQGAFEYILMLGGTLLVVAVVILAIRGQLSGTGQNVNQSTGTAKTLTCAPTDMGQYSPQMLASWRFSEGTGTTTIDSSGKGNEGTLAGGASWTGGKYGNAIGFDGASGYVNLGSGTALNAGTNSITIMFWEKTAVGNFANFICKNNCYGAVLNAWVVRQEGNSGKLGLNFGDADSYQYLSGNKVVADNTWHHIAIVIDRAGAITFYVDGAADVSVPASGIAEPQGGSGPAKIGGNIGGAYAYLNGAMDEVKVYNRALSQAEIRDDAFGQPPI